MVKKIRPYLHLIQHNRNFRNLWLSQSISNFGDWFGVLATYDLVIQYGKSEFLLGLIIIVKMLGFALFSPIAGYIADRYNRRQLMIIADVLRAIIVLGFLLVVSIDSLWLAYVLTGVQMMISAVFEPAKNSSIPNITSKEELVRANVLSSATWSIIFSLGMGIGGLATAYLGTDAVFLIDSLSYLFSGILIYKTHIPQRVSKSLSEQGNTPWNGVVQGFMYLRVHRQVLRPVLAKGVYTLFLGGLVYGLVILAEDVLEMGALGIGLLYASRGLGTAVGPIVARRVFPDSRTWIKAIGFFMLISGFFYGMIGAFYSLPLALIFVFLAHCASGGNWVLSTVLLQERTEDEFRGRVFSTEFMGFTLAQTFSTFVASTLLEWDWISVLELNELYGGLLALMGVMWLATIAREEKLASVQKKPQVFKPERFDRENANFY